MKTDLVLVIEHNLPPAKWKTGRITKTFAGADILIRNVQLRTAGKKRRMERPIQKLVLLPRDEVEESADSARGQCVATEKTSTELEAHETLPDTMTADSSTTK